LKRDLVSSPRDSTKRLVKKKIERKELENLFFPREEKEVNYCQASLKEQWGARRRRETSAKRQQSIIEKGEPKSAEVLGGPLKKKRAVENWKRTI